MTTIEQEVLEKLQELPTEKQQEVLDFVDSLLKTSPKNRVLVLKGFGRRWKRALYQKNSAKQDVRCGVIFNGRKLNSEAK